MRIHYLENLFYLIAVILIRCEFGNASAECEECEKLIIEGGSRALKQIFVDFNEMKAAISEIRTSIHEFDARNATKLKDLPQMDLRYDSLPKKCITDTLPKDCAEATACTRRSGIYKLQVEKYSFEPFYAECDANTENGDWLVIQRRHDGSEDFFRNWEEYEKGFGDVQGEFFIGLKKLYALTNYNGPQELMIVMEAANGTQAYAKYDNFVIGNDTELYKLKRIGKFSGTAGDSLKAHLNMKFTTKDRDNDTHATLNCAAHFSAAWWYAACHSSNLNGVFGDNTYGKGINWLAFSGHNASLKYTKMMIRRRRSS